MASCRRLPCVKFMKVRDSMLKKIRTILCIALAAMLLSSCAKEATTPDPVEAEARDILPSAEPTILSPEPAALLNGSAVAEFSYRGEWENDTTDYKLQITRAVCTFTSVNEGRNYSSTYEETEQGLLLLDDIWVRPMEDGGLQVSGYKGVFYPVGEGKGADTPFRPYMGSWYNEETEDMLQIQEGAFISPTESSFSAGGCTVLEDGSLSLGENRIAYINANGELVVSGEEGVYIKAEEE